MARITVEDCITKIPNRFELVVVAGHRAKQIGSGSPLTVDRDNDKNPVVALREIAEDTIDPEAIRNSLIDLHRQYAQAEPQEEELEDLLEQELAGTRHIADIHAREVTAEMSEDDLSDEDGDFDEATEGQADKGASLYQDADVTDE